MRSRAALALLVAFVATSARAHGEASDDIVATLDKAGAALQGIEISLHKTQAHQLVIANKTGKVLEILDAQGRPFLRIGAQQVEADMAAAAWYRSYTPGGIGMPAMESNDPRWTAVSKTAAWGWFDVRLRTGDLKVPHKSAERKHSATLGQWKIPVRVDGKPTAISGSFRYTPPPAGQFVARLTVPEQVRPGIHAQVLPGPVPGLYITNTTAETLVVFGRNDEPFIRIGPEGVFANVKSPTWQHSARAEVSSDNKTLADAKAPPQWVMTSPSASFSWIETRAAYRRSGPPAGIAKRGVKSELQRWHIPMQLGDTRLELGGATDWVPTQFARLSHPAGHRP